MNLETFSGKVVLITGSASGMGLTTAMAFGRRGASLILGDINEAAGKKLVDDLNALNVDAIFVKTDVSQPEDCEGLVATAKERFGRLDVAFNNAGISDTLSPPPTDEYPLDLWQRIINIDLSGVFYCLRYELPLLLATGGGAIVNTASINGVISSPRTPAYTAAKHGVIGLTKVICNEYARKNIRCNAIAPGIIATPLNAEIISSEKWHDVLKDNIPAGSFGCTQDIANAVVWLCSPESHYINGVCLPVDGGFLVR